MIQSDEIGKLRRRAFVAIAAVCTAAASSIAVAQQAQPAPYQNPYALPHGCRITFELGPTELSVDADWLDLSTLLKLRIKFGKDVCPPQPVTTGDVWFGRSALDGLDIRNGLGRSYLSFNISDASGYTNGPVTAALPADRPRDQAVDTSIALRKNAPDNFTRYYDIRYRSLSEVMSGQVTIHCYRVRDRECGPAPIPRYAGLLVFYRYSQRVLPIGEIASTDPSTEPGAILQFDQRIREWLMRIAHTR